MVTIDINKKSTQQSSIYYLRINVNIKSRWFNTALIILSELLRVFRESKIPNLNSDCEIYVAIRVWKNRELDWLSVVDDFIVAHEKKVWIQSI